MPLWGTTIDENFPTNFQDKQPCPFGAHEYMKIQQHIFKVNRHDPLEHNDKMKISLHIPQANRLAPQEHNNTCRRSGN